MDLMELLGNTIDGNVINQLSQNIGGSPEQTQQATQGILTTLLGALSNNASTPEGAQNLTNALEKDHDGSILSDIAGFLGGNSQANQSSTGNGMGILNHILGDKIGSVTNMISNVSGLDGNQTGNLMSQLAPLLMGVLGQSKQQGGLDVSGLASILGGTVQNQQQNNPLMQMATKFLDQDGDGSVMDDLLNIGMKFLKK